MYLVYQRYTLAYPYWIRRLLIEFPRLFFKRTKGLPYPPVPWNSASTNTLFASRLFWIWYSVNGGLLCWKLPGLLPRLNQTRKSRAFVAFKPVPNSGVFMPAKRHLNRSKRPFLMNTKSHVSPSWTLITLAFTVVYDGGKPDERETWLFVTFCNWLITFVVLEIRIFWNTFDDDFERLVSQVPYMTESNAVA